MVQLIQAYRRPSPIAEAVREASHSFFGNRMQAELQRTQLREAEAKENAIAGMATKYGPEFGDAARLGMDLGEFNLFSTAQNPQVDPYSRDFTRAQAGSGMAASSWGTSFTQEQERLAQQAQAALVEQRRQANARLAQDQSQFDAGLAEKQRQFNMEPTNVVQDGRPVIAPLTEAYGQAPVLSQTQAQGTITQNVTPQLSLDEQKQIAGVTPRKQTVADYFMSPDGSQTFPSYDGVTDARTGAPLPPNSRPLGKTSVQAANAQDAGFTTSTQSGLESEAIALRKFKQQIQPIREMATQLGPAGFGPGGVIRRWTQTAAGAANSLDELLGGQGEYTRRVNSIASVGLDPNNPADLSPLFDPNLPKLESAANLLVYSAASALASQEGRGLSDNDVKMFRKIVGDPTSLFTSQANFLSRLDFLEDTVQSLTQTNQDVRAGNLDAQPATAGGNNLNDDVELFHGALERMMGTELPITSAYRDPAHNEAVGGVPKSQHLHGNAIDIDVSRLTPEQRQQLIESASALGFTGIGVYDNAIHLDVGDRRAWGPDYSHNSVPQWAQTAIERHLGRQAGVAQPRRLRYNQQTGQLEPAG